MPKHYQAKLIGLALIIAGFVAVLLTNNIAINTAQAFSAGPPPGYTGAPSEFTCSECHMAPDAGTGKLTITAPPTYTPGRTYQITVAHSNNDQTRQRWGFQLTALGDDGDRAGTLQNQDNFTQVITDAGPGNKRQYIEHTSSGTFFGQHNAASWTFNWTAPAEDVGPVTFYLAGNQANGDGNTSGDNIYFTFISAAYQAPTPDFAIAATPSSRTIFQGNSATYDVTVTPSAGFTGTVTLSVSGLPAGASASFSPTSINITDATPKTSTLTVTTSASTPASTSSLTVTGASGSLQRSANVSLSVANATSADLSLSQTASPNPVTAGTTLSYRLVVTNNGPIAATGVTAVDNLPAGATFVSATPSQGTCSGTGPVTCNFGSMPVGGSASATIVVRPASPGSLTNTASVSGNENDPNTTNNTATTVTNVDPQATSPTVSDPNLIVRPVIAGLNQPISLAFLGLDDMLVLERATGKVQRVRNGVLLGTAIDLAVNSASERGLLGISLHPNFATNKFVYLYWTWRGSGDGPGGLLGADTDVVSDVPLLGNRVDRFIWNGSTLTFDRNLIMLRALQADANQPQRGNHNGGVLRFGPDGKLYIIIGDNGRRGQLQNLPSGPTDTGLGTIIPDDQFGGPQPDNAHFTGEIIRLNDDGSAATDNPFYNHGTQLGGEAGANLQKLYAYGVRNSFGMAFDPISGNLWTEENGDDSFDEINRVEPGFNGGWVQVMGPLSRLAEYKAIEVSRPGGLQQVRWPPERIANTSQEALSRLFTLPGARYSDPQFSWKYAVAPAAIGFMRGRGLGAQYEGDLLVGASRTNLLNGYLFRMKLSADRRSVASDDPRLADKVADNADKFDITESESLLFGRDFGVATDIQTGPNGNLYVVSLSNGAVYEISARPTIFVATLTGGQEVPPTNSPATGTGTVLLSADETTATVSLNFSGLSANQTAAHIHGPAAPGETAAVLFDIGSQGRTSGSFTNLTFTLTPQQVQQLKSGLLYFNVHSTAFTSGEIRGEIQAAPNASVLQISATSFTALEGAGSATITVNRLGNSSSALTVDYATSDNTASGQSDYIAAYGTLSFAPGETSKTFTVLLIDDAYAEGDETINLSLLNPTGGAFPGSPTTATLAIVDNDAAAPSFNPVDNAEFFVRQQYLDFLNREPDSPGLAYWTNEITKCGSDTRCLTRRRVDVSAAFFIEQEFQQTGYFVYRLYKATLERRLTFAEFIQDRSRLIEGPGREAMKQTLVEDFVRRPEFQRKYPSSGGTPPGAEFIEALIQAVRRTSGVDLSDRRTEFQNNYNSFASRALIVRLVIDDPRLVQAEYNRAFVLAEYFSFLRRDPDEPGYQFWLDVVNNREVNNYLGMVCAFVTSREYQERFSSVVTRRNTECAR